MKTMVFVGMVMLFLYTVLWFVPFRGSSIETKLDKGHAYTTKELIRCRAYVVNQINDIAKKVDRDKKGHMIYPEDVEAGRAIAALMKQDAVVLNGNYSPQDTMAILKNADLIMGMRLHSLIMGAALLKPMVGLSYDPKVTSFMQLLRQPDCYAVDSVESAQLIRSMSRLQKQTENEKQMLARNMEIIARQAKAPAEMIRSLQK